MRWSTSARRPRDRRSASAVHPGRPRAGRARRRGAAGARGRRRRRRGRRRAAGLPHPEGLGGTVRSGRVGRPDAPGRGAAGGGARGRRGAGAGAGHHPIGNRRRNRTLAGRPRHRRRAERGRSKLCCRAGDPPGQTARRPRTGSAREARGRMGGRVGGEAVAGRFGDRHPLPARRPGLFPWRGSAGPHRQGPGPAVAGTATRTRCTGG